MYRLRTLIFLIILSGSLSVSGQLDASFQVDTNDIHSYTIHLSSNYQLSDTSAFTFVWNFGDGQSSHLPIVSHSYEIPGNYLVSFMVSNAGSSASSSLQIMVKNKVEVPNVFTPNGDGINDFLVLRTNGQTLYSLAIYNSSGTLVYKKDSYTFTWDGKSPSGVAVFPGVYYYVLTFENKFVKSGFFHLIR